MHKIACALALALMLVPLVTAQEPAPDAVVTDPESDVAYLVAEGQAVPATPAESHGRADLLDLTISETVDALTFHVTVASMDEWPAGSGRWLDAASLDVRFWVGDLFYNVRTGSYDDGVPFGELRGGTPDYSEPIIETNMDATLEGTTFSIAIDRGLLRDHNGAPVQTGMQLTQLWVDSHVHATGLFLQNPDGSLFQPLGIRDRMPDTGSVSFDVLQGGPEVAGAMLMQTPTPFRSSNGGEATIAYTYIVHNLDDSDAAFNARIDGTPAGWDLDFLPRFVVPGGETVQASIVVHTPFGHQHGGTEEFQLRVERADEAGTWAEATMGILYLATPQPAGHHDTVYFHSHAPQSYPAADMLVQTLGAAFPQPWMDTLQENPEDEGAAILGLTHNNIGPTPGYSWWVCLQPHLQLGLDVNLTQVGSIDVPLSAPRPMSGAVSVELFHLASGSDRLDSCLPSEWSGRNATTVAAGASAGSADINGGHTFTMDLQPDADADFISYAPGTDLVFRIDFLLDAAEPTVAGPSLEPGGSARLPLDEYFDEHPAGIVHEGDDDGHQQAEEDHGHDEEKDTPLPLLLPLAAVFWAARRRQ